MTTQFELIAATTALQTHAARSDEQQTTLVEPPAFTVTASDGLVFASPGGDSQSTLTRCFAADSEHLGFRVVQLGACNLLAVLLPPGSLINGVPALHLTLLQSRDLIATPDGQLLYVTERVHPVCGPPPAALIGQKCAVCRIKVAAEDYVLGCRCGAVVHLETAETTPDKPPADRCSCGEKLKSCPVCGQMLSREPYRIFDPWQM